jgi:RHS repeat-associated protein
MHTEYTYDASGRQDSIHHKDGATVKQGDPRGLSGAVGAPVGGYRMTTSRAARLGYTAIGLSPAFKNAGRSRTSRTFRHSWFDGCTEETVLSPSAHEFRTVPSEHVIEAIRGNSASATILATYEYTYDDGDNMLTKTVPWYDDFQDGNATGWSGHTANYSVVNGELRNTLDVSTWRDLYLSESDADHDLKFDYIRYTSTGTAWIILRYTDNNNYLYLEINPTVIHLRQRDGGTLTTLDTISTTVAEDVAYNLRAILDGANISVYWGAPGASFDEILSTASATELTTARAAYFRLSTNSEHGFDNVQLIAGTRSTVETFTYNDANEQITHAKNGVTTTMTYDDWGRLEERDDGTHTATYGYRYGGMLYSVVSDFPGEGSVTYETGGDGKRRSRIAGAEETWYNYTAGFGMISTENSADGSSGALTMTCFLRSPTANESVPQGDAAGTSPGSGAARYYLFDHLGNTRSAWSTSKMVEGDYGFDPYGAEYAHTGAPLAVLAGAYTGKSWDADIKMFRFPYRQLSPSRMRWISRDPLGMIDGPNSYSAVRNNPVKYVDRIGLQTYPYYAHEGPSFHEWATSCRKLAEQVRNDTLSIRWLNHGLPRDSHRHAKMQHCVSSCEIKKKGGHMCSVLAGWGEEFFGGEFNLEDASMNQKGRDCACGKTSCIECCKEATK